MLSFFWLHNSISLPSNQYETLVWKCCNTNKCYFAYNAISISGLNNTFVSHSTEVSRDIYACLSSKGYQTMPWCHKAWSYSLCWSRQLIVVVAKIAGLLYWRSWVRTPGKEPKNFQNWLSSAENHQPDDRMQHKARGCLVLSVLCWGK